VVKDNIFNAQKLANSMCVVEAVAKALGGHTKF